MVARGTPGVLLGFFVVAGTVAAALAVRPTTGRMILPVPVLSYLVAALISGVIHDPAVVSSKTQLAVGAAQWIANGFFAMALATVLAAVITAVRWYLWRRRRPAPRAPRWPVTRLAPAGTRPGGTLPGGGRRPGRPQRNPGTPGASRVPAAHGKPAEGNRPQAGRPQAAQPAPGRAARPAGAMRAREARL